LLFSALHNTQSVGTHFITTQPTINKPKVNANRPFILALTILIATTITSCGTFEKATTLNSDTGRFPAKNKTVTILKKVSVNADTLKTLIIVPNTPYWREMTKNMKYFKEVMTFAELQKDIIAKGLTDKIPTISDRIGLNNAYKYYRPFVILNMTKEQKPGKGWYAGLTLYDPGKADYIFQNEIWLNLMWDGWTDQGTMYPLFNSLLNYLHEQE